MAVKVHPTAEVSPDAKIGDGTITWHYTQIHKDASIGIECIIGKGVYIEENVDIGNRVKIQSDVTIAQGVTIRDGVFIGPNVGFTNDKYPRAINEDGSLKTSADWTISETLIETGVSLGANATIVCGVKIGEWAMVGAGSVVTREVPNYGLVLGNPARLKGFVCKCGQRLAQESMETNLVIGKCTGCGERQPIPLSDWHLLND